MTRRMSVPDLLDVINDVLSDGKHHTHGHIVDAFAAKHGWPGASGHARRARTLLMNAARRDTYWCGPCTDSSHVQGNPDGLECFGDWVVSLSQNSALGQTMLRRRLMTLGKYARHAVMEARAVQTYADPGTRQVVRETERTALRLLNNVVPQLSQEMARDGYSDDAIERAVTRLSVD